MFVLVLKYSNKGSYRTYEEWKHAHQIINDEPSLFVLTVPMRNGNLTCKAYPSAVRNSSYRTYEEWKQRTVLRTQGRPNNRSYRTYEEWKPCTLWV